MNWLTPKRTLAAISFWRDPMLDPVIEPAITTHPLTAADRPVSIHRFRMDKPHLYRSYLPAFVGMRAWTINPSPPVWSSNSVLWSQAWHWIVTMEREGRLK